MIARLLILELSLPSIAAIGIDLATGKQVPIGECFIFCYEKLYNRAVQEGLPWATWLANQILTALHREPGKRSVLASYEFSAKFVKVSFLVRSTRCFNVFHQLIGGLVEETGRDYVRTEAIRPIALWDGSAKILYRLFPLPIPPSDISEEDQARLLLFEGNLDDYYKLVLELYVTRKKVLCVDHGTLSDFFVSSSIDKAWAKYQQKHIDEYADYELVPSKPKSVLKLPNEQIVYYNAFIRLI